MTTSEESVALLSEIEKSFGDLSISEKKLNKGETGELTVVRKLFSLAQDNDTKILTSIFGEDASSGITLCDIDTQVAISNIRTIKKSKSTQKADCLVKLNKTGEFLYISIKCGHGAMSSIINHTPRSAKVFQSGGKLFPQLPELDKLIQLLNTERKEKGLGEDMHLKNMLLTDDAKNCIISVVKYFMFEGTGSREAKFPCNAMLVVPNPSNVLGWQFNLCNTEETKTAYVKSVYDKLILSMRHKGMPKTKKRICDPWIFVDGVREKGSLHIRLKN